MIEPAASRIAGLVLAAGASRRLGEAKQTARIGAENLLERAVRGAREAGLQPLLVVLGSGADEITRESSLGEVEVILHTGWAEGMGSSLRRGMEALREREHIDGVVVMTCDMPAVDAAHLRALSAAGNEVVASGYGGRAGVPAYFPAAMFGLLETMQGEMGAREMLQGARVVDLDGAALDVDTPEQLRAARAMLAPEASGDARTETSLTKAYASRNGREQRTRGAHHRSHAPRELDAQE